MKAMRNRFAIFGLPLLLAFFALFPQWAGALVVVTAEPPSPTIGDSVSIRIQGTGGAAAAIQSISRSPSGQIVIDISSICFGTEMNVDLVASLGRLPAGNYSVALTESTGGCTSASGPFSFTVRAGDPGLAAIPTLSSLSLGVTALALMLLAFSALSKDTGNRSRREAERSAKRGERSL